MGDFQKWFPDPATGDKRPAVWRDKGGVMHRAVGNQMVSHDYGTFIMWTACGQKDIPANGAWLQNAGDDVTCEGCQQAERIFEEELAEARQANSQFGVGA